MTHVLIVGYGFMGKIHAQAYESIPHVEITGIVDSYLKEEKVKLPSGREVPVFHTLSQAFQAVFCSVVDLCVPTDLHVTLGLEALKNKKHLFCEKPIALTVEGADLLEQARKEAAVEACSHICELCRKGRPTNGLGEHLTQGLIGKFRERCMAASLRTLFNLNDEYFTSQHPMASRESSATPPTS